MILEIAELEVAADRQDEFESVIRKASADALPAARGLVRYSLHRCIEHPQRYTLLLRWQSLEDHTVHFRSSAAQQRWRDAVAPFLAKTPAAWHFDLIEDNVVRPDGG